MAGSRDGKGILCGGCPASGAAAHHATPSAGHGFGSDLAIVGANPQARVMSGASTDPLQVRFHFGVGEDPEPSSLIAASPSFPTFTAPRRLCRDCLWSRGECPNERSEPFVTVLRDLGGSLNTTHARSSLKIRKLFVNPSHLAVA